MLAHTILTVGSNNIQRAVQQSDGVWQVSTHLDGLHPTTLTQDRLQPAVAWAGTDGHGVFLTADCGQTWSPAGLDGMVVKSLCVSPHDSATIYAGLKPAGVYKSTDAGHTWRELNGFRHIPNRWWWFSPAEKPFQAYVMALSVSATDPAVILAGIELGAVVRSEDGGQTWSGHRQGALRDCHALQFHASDGAWAYEAGGTGAGAAVSRDGGRTWQQPRAGLARHYGVACAADPERPELWYVAVAPSPRRAFAQDGEAYLYRSSGGSDWQPIGWEPHPMTDMPTALVTLPATPGHLVAGTRNGRVWHSPDYGDTWQRLPLELESNWLSLVVV